MTREPRSLTWRLYAFASVIVLVSIGTLLLTVRLVGRRPDDDPGYAVYDRHGQLVTSHGTVAVPAPEDLTIATDAVSTEGSSTVIGLGPDRIGVWKHHGRPSGQTIILFLLGVIAFLLVLALLATFGFARTIAGPLRTLGATARALGSGNLAARSNLTAPGELGAVGHAFDEMAGRIEQLLRTQRAMMADISHELRTPLTRIKLALDLASADPKGAQQVLDDVGTDLEEIEQIIEDVFVVVRLDSADGAIVRRAEVDVGELLARSAERFEAHHPAHPLTFEPATAPILAHADGALVRRAIDNLLDNAAKYSPAGTGVVLRLRESADARSIEVIDQGIGMSVSEVERAFTPFWRADHSRTRDTGGVGLGLALARRIARAHGGDVELESRRDVGTIARFTMARADTVGNARNTRS
ncbi:MAG TPA: HAMP domain-containing sensor histidine kinase [Kofleriaceae bacterium]|jgi:signal transduction histidine kinase